MLTSNGLIIGNGAHPWLRIGRNRHIELHCPQKFTIRVEDLDPEVAAIRNVDVTRSVSGDAVRCIELPILVSGFSKRLHPVAILVVFGDSGIDVSIADENVALTVPGYVCGLPELTVDRWPWRSHARPRDCSFIRSFLLAAKYHFDAAFRIELDDHVGAFVHGPDVVVAIDSHGVRVG